MRAENTIKVLMELERSRPLSRTELTDITGMSATSITRIISRLQELGLVREENVLPSSGPGRKAVKLDICSGGVYTIGFHISAEWLYCCLMDFSRRIVFESREALPASPASARLLSVSILSFLNQITRKTSVKPERIRAVGISIPGCVDAAHGSVVRSQFLGWNDLPLARELECGVNLPVYIENDVRSCVFWEQCLSPAAGRDSIAYLYVGSSGIGFANTDGGHVIRGVSNSAGEIQDMSDGFSGSLSDFMLPEKLIAKAHKYCPDTDSLQDITEACRIGAPWAKLLINEFRNSLKTVLHIIDAFMDPGRVILGGDAIDAFREFLTDLFTQGVSAGTDYENCCASGAAGIAMDFAVTSLIRKQEV